MTLFIIVFSAYGFSSNIWFSLAIDALAFKTTLSLPTKNAAKLIFAELVMFAGIGIVKFLVTVLPLVVPVTASPIILVIALRSTWLCSKLTIGFSPLK